MRMESFGKSYNGDSLCAKRPDNKEKIPTLPTNITIISTIFPASEKAAVTPKLRPTVE